MYPTKYLVFWNPCEKEIEYSKADLFMDIFSKNQNVISIDLKNNKDPRSLRLLRKADLIVLFLKQSFSSIDTYFQNDLLRRENILYVISDYIQEESESLEKIQKRFRIPANQLLVLPFNNRIPFARDKGCLGKYLQGRCMNHHFESAVEFFPCYRKIRERIEKGLSPDNEL